QREYTAVVYAGADPLGTGHGSTKQAAEQEAARAALIELDRRASGRKGRQRRRAEVEVEQAPPEPEPEPPTPAAEAPQPEPEPPKPRRRTRRRKADEPPPEEPAVNGVSDRELAEAPTGSI